MQSLSRIFLEVLLIITFVILIFYSLKNSDLKIDLTVIAFFFVASLKVLPSINKIINCVQKLKFADATIKLLYDTLSKFEVDKTVNEHKPKVLQSINKFNLKNNLNLNNIYYKYGKNKIINNLSLSIKFGQVVLVCGPSGTGKTTLIELIIGLILPEQGDIKYGKNSIYDHLNLWQKKISYVSQSSYLIEDTLLNNILFDKSNTKVDLKKINKVLEIVCLKDFVESDEIGLKKIINSNANNISGGQAQRIGIARALYQDFDILILDESLNSLDKLTSNQILKNLKHFYKDKLIIIVSHNDHLRSIADITVETKNFLK